MNKNKRKTPIIIIIICILIITSFSLGRITAPKVIVDQTSLNQPPTVINEKTVNKSYTFPVYDDKGNKLAEIVYTIQSSDLQNEVILKGQRATAIKGKIFLILNLKLRNDTNKNILINSRDYIRISVNKNSDLLAADIHNDPVDVEAISTQYTRIGFSVNSSAKNFTIHVGEINGKKTMIPLEFSLKK